MRTNRSSHHAVELTAAPLKRFERNQNRIGLKVQNQEASAIIYYRSGGNGHARSFIAISAGQMLTVDINASTEELWLYSNTNGAVATVVEDFE